LNVLGKPISAVQRRNTAAQLDGRLKQVRKRGFEKLFIFGALFYGAEDSIHSTISSPPGGDSGYDPEGDAVVQKRIRTTRWREIGLKVVPRQQSP
jgi:hypothetical protein